MDLPVEKKKLIYSKNNYYLKQMKDHRSDVHYCDGLSFAKNVYPQYKYMNFIYSFHNCFYVIVP